MTERFAYHPEVQDAWDTYVTAKHLAEQTREFGDGCTAARLWRRFLNLYEEKITFRDDNHLCILPSACDSDSRRSKR